MDKLSDVLKAQGYTGQKTSDAIMKSYSKPPPRCAICGDFGWVHPIDLDGRPDFDAVSRCGCKAHEDSIQHRDRLWRWCELPEDISWMTFDTFKQEPGNAEAYAAIYELVAHTEIPSWVTLQAKVGRGKTHLAVAACRAWLDKGDPARYAFVPLLLEELRNSYEDKNFHARFTQYLTVPLLILDDLGAERHRGGDGVDWATEQLTTILDYRAMHKLSLIVTTNKSLSSLADDEHRIMSRLRRYPWCKVIVIEGPEHRA